MFNFKYSIDMASTPSCPKCGNTSFSCGTIAAGSLGHVPVIHCNKCGCIISVVSNGTPNTVIVTNPVVTKKG